MATLCTAHLPISDISNANVKPQLWYRAIAIYLMKVILVSMVYSMTAQVTYRCSFAKTHQQVRVRSCSQRLVKPLIEHCSQDDIAFKNLYCFVVVDVLHSQLRVMSRACNMVELFVMQWNAKVQHSQPPARNTSSLHISCMVQTCP